MDKEKGDRIKLDDRAKGEVYVCFEGPLGAHLKKEVKEKIWKDEYVEIFSLLPLEKFNLDKGKKEDSKKEEEEKRRWRLIPQTFANWQQAFFILAGVIGEKFSENCTGLFCYVDAIGEAYRAYGGQAWLRYDEQFRQRKAIRPEIKWEQNDIDSEKMECRLPEGKLLALRQEVMRCEKLRKCKAQKEEIRTQLSDLETYRPVSSNPTFDIARDIKGFIAHHLQEGSIDEKLGDYLFNQHPVLPVFYTLPKIHKHPSRPPGRPIVASTNSLLSPLAITLEKILSPLVPRIKSFLKDTSQFWSHFET
ncbi:unnamed protein product [Ranitomeya imitator]|uniref:Uncharacterized protein n=1 Tax=Ranitomeya imitator TaxID=111125 RepID=A0ABN9LQH7_9NEOB|nr:unnamed protein product [Ranitomeya imitator]